MRILLSNDDGIEAEGLAALYASLKQVARVFVVAPDRPRSACGHSITLHKPLRMSETRLPDGETAWVTSGTPADCVTLGLLEVLQGEPPDLVVSGINHGPNLGWDVYYSGTVSAAIEGALSGIPSLAISLAWRFRRRVEEAEGPLPPMDFADAAGYAPRLARWLADEPMPEYSILNVNVPPRPPLGVRVTGLGVRRYPAHLDRRQDPAGRAYYWIGGEDPVDILAADTDVEAIRDGFVSVTPISLDLTSRDYRRRILAAGIPDLDGA